MREFDSHSTQEEVDNMTVEDAIHVLERHASTDGKMWSARPHMAKACRMAIKALSYYDPADTEELM